MIPKTFDTVPKTLKQLQWGAVPEDKAEGNIKENRLVSIIWKCHKLELAFCGSRYFPICNKKPVSVRKTLLRIFARTKFDPHA